MLQGQQSKRDIHVFVNVLLFIALLATLIAAILGLASCNTAKQLEKHTSKTYRKLDAFAPISKEDSVHLADRSAKTFPIKKDTVVKQGKTITRTIIKEDKTKAAALAKTIDSLLDSNGALNELLDHIDTTGIRDKIRKELAANCKPVTIYQTDTRTDTIYRQAPEDAILIATLQLDKEAAIKAKYKADNTLEISHKNSITKNWIIGGLLLLIVGYLLIKVWTSKTNKITTLV